MTTVLCHEKNQSTNEKFITLYITSLIENVSELKNFEIRITDIIRDLFRKSELYTLDTTRKTQSCDENFKFRKRIGIDSQYVETNMTYYQIIELGKKMIHTNYDNILFNNRRIFVINNIISNILKTNDSVYVSDMFDELENGCINKYTDFYSYILANHELKLYHLNIGVMKDVICRIIENQTRELNNANKKCSQCISSTLDEIKFSLGSDCDVLFDGDYPISKSILINSTDSIFDAMDFITQLTIIGCVESIEVLLKETSKISDLEYIRNLAIVSLRYKNDYCYFVLTGIIEKVKNNKLCVNSCVNQIFYDLERVQECQKKEDIYNNTKPDDPKSLCDFKEPVLNAHHNYGEYELSQNPIFTSNNDDDENDTPYVKIDDVMYNNNYQNFFDINLLCTSYRIYYKTEKICTNEVCIII
jgi:hypothetical protein